MSLERESVSAVAPPEIPATPRPAVLQRYKSVALGYSRSSDISALNWGTAKWVTSASLRNKKAPYHSNVRKRALAPDGAAGAA